MKNRLTRREAPAPSVRPARRVGADRLLVELDPPARAGRQLQAAVLDLRRSASMTRGPAFSSGQPGVPAKPGMCRRGPSSPKRKMLVLSPRKPRSRISAASRERSSRVSI